MLGTYGVEVDSYLKSLRSLQVHIKRAGWPGSLIMQPIVEKNAGA